ncbi:MAG: malonate decarboxylase holo-[acyl-carrier-protein] synthase [Burkholderiales bacterium]|nr:malonate decarboxylase holo-[acyl-carrier-protein] synthase [Burkholderiales bacterium]
MPATPLQRHDLVWLHASAWQRVLAGTDDEPPWDAAALDCLRHWAAADLPLVVTRQPPPGPGAPAPSILTLGLAAPRAWGRQRLFVRTARAGVRRRGAFPPLAQVTDQLPGAARAGARALDAALRAAGVVARVYGSHGWQALTGWPTLHAGSDVDLLLPVADAEQARAAVQALAGAAFAQTRLDGELLFADGTAVAWREWAAWRAGAVAQLLVKRLHGAALLPGAAVGR